MLKRNNRVDTRIHMDACARLHASIWTHVGLQLVPGTRYQVPGAWYLGTWYLVPGTRYQVPGTRYQVHHPTPAALGPGLAPYGDPFVFFMLTQLS